MPDHLPRAHCQTLTLERASAARLRSTTLSGTAPDGLAREKIQIGDSSETSGLQRKQDLSGEWSRYRSSLICGIAPSGRRSLLTLVFTLGVVSSVRIQRARGRGAGMLFAGDDFTRCPRRSVRRTYKPLPWSLTGPSRVYAPNAASGSSCTVPKGDIAPDYRSGRGPNGPGRPVRSHEIDSSGDIIERPPFNLCKLDVKTAECFCIHTKKFHR